MSGAISGAGPDGAEQLPHLASLMRATTVEAFSRRVVDGAGDPNAHAADIHEFMVKHGGQKYRSDDQIIISHVKTQTSLTTVAARFAMILVSRGSRTEFLASALFLAVAAGATIVKADEGRRDARCGWGLQRAARAKWGSMASIRSTTINIRTFGLKRRAAKSTTWHLRRVIMPRRSITGRLVRGQVWRRHDGRRWLYKKFVA